MLHSEGVVHGFLALSTLDGVKLADGELIQTSQGDRVTSRLVFHFLDGSIQDETVVFTQRKRFHVLSDHLIQQGPTFPIQVDMTMDGTSGQTTVRYTDRGKANQTTERIKLPADLANGIVPNLLKNLPPGVQGLDLSLVAPTPKPRLVKLVVRAAGEDPFAVGKSTRKAIHYLIKVELGGIAGIAAPLLGKQPPDSHVWIMPGEAPAFVRSEGPLYAGGPLCRIDLVSPAWP